MKEKIKQFGVFIKRKLGFCNFKGCWKRGYYELELPRINLKRNLCEKHLENIVEDIKNDPSSEFIEL